MGDSMLCRIEVVDTMDRALRFLMIELDIKRICCENNEWTR